MTRLLRTTAAVAALVVVAGAPAAARSEPPTLPFRGYATTVDEPTEPPDDCPDFADWRYTSSGSGTFTHLGRAQVSVTHCSWMTGPTTGAFGYSDVVITAADGDTVTVEHSGTFELGSFGPEGPTTSTVEGTWTITGGTGRFAGATGSGTLAGVGDLVAGTMPARWDGVISYTPSDRSQR